MNRPIYLDYAATTPVCLPALEAVFKCLGPKAEFGNPHSTTHAYGDNAAAVIEASTAAFATAIGAEPETIIWTSGATESNNLALQGAAHFYKARGKHLITTQTEHKSVLDVFQALEQEGFAVTYLPVQKNGRIDLNLLQDALRQETILVSVMAVNNELGILQPLREIAEIVKKNNSLLHVDAAQSLGKIPFNVADLQIDLASFSGHKIYAPKGIGALYVRRQPRIHLKPLFYGGGQQKGIRPGTLSPALISAFVKGFEFAQQDLQQHPDKYKQFRDLFLSELKHAKVAFKLNTDLNHAVPHIINLHLENIDGSLFLAKIQEELAIAQGSACNSDTLIPSHVLRAIGLKSREADCSFRISFGAFTTTEEVKQAADIIIKNSSVHSLP